STSRIRRAPRVALCKTTTVSRIRQNGPCIYLTVKSSSTAWLHKQSTFKRSEPKMQTFLQDLRFGLRMLRRSPGFSVLATLCLILGIGTNAAVLSWIEGILIRPYPLVAHQDRMFALNATTRGQRGFTGLSYPDSLDYKKNSTLFESFIVDRITGTTLSVGDRAERASGAIVSANYFDALGVRPMLGRGFRPEEAEGRNAHPVAVLAEKPWKDRHRGERDSTSSASIT